MTLSRDIKISSWPKENVDDFLKICLDGFGSMNKNDYEVAMFNTLLKNDLQYMSDFDISRLLRIPESKVKRLRYEAALKYPTNNDDEYKKAFIELLTHGKFRVTENHRIQFAISDKLFRLYINDLLMRDGRFADSSFNPNIISLPWKDLEYLLVSFDQNVDDKLDIIKESVKDSNVDLPKTLLESMKEVGVGIVKNAARKIADDSLSEFLDLVFDKAKILINEKMNNK